jgi:hypothetical protein
MSQKPLEPDWKPVWEPKSPIKLYIGGLCEKIAGLN